MATVNASDFLILASRSELHAGLMVLRSQGMPREEQWEWLESVVSSVLVGGDDLTDRVVEAFGPGDFVIRKIPPE